MAQPRPANLRIDSERLMAAVTTLADPKLEGRAAGRRRDRGTGLDRRALQGRRPAAGSSAFVIPFK